MVEVFERFFRLVWMLLPDPCIGLPQWKDAQLCTHMLGSSQRFLLTGHVTGVDTRRRELYCFTCCDYVYDTDFDNAMLVRLLLILSEAVPSWEDVISACWDCL